MKTYAKQNFPVSEARRYLEPGPVVLVSSHHAGKSNIMTLAWHTVMEFTPALIGCVIAEGNHSFGMIRKSRQCVINVPSVDIAKTVVDIGNCSGADTDKFDKFGLTPVAGAQVTAPLIAQCPVSLECVLTDAAFVKKYNFFVFEVVAAHAAKSPRYPRTIHYQGDGQFMVAGREMSLRGRFKPEML